MIEIAFGVTDGIRSRRPAICGTLPRAATQRNAGLGFTTGFCGPVRTRPLAQ